MEMEHINENTIRVLIKGEDLAARGFTFLDLLGNKEEIESFFYSILEEVDIEEEFKGSEAVTFQVMPKGDGLELFISKNTSQDGNHSFEEFQEEIGTLPSWLSKLEEYDDLDEEDEDEENEIYAREEIILDNLNPAQKAEFARRKGFIKPPAKTLVFELVNFELVIWLAHEVTLQEVESTLYEMNHHYYLEIRFLNSDLSEQAIRNYAAHLAEFGRQSPVTSAVLGEHATTLMSKDALESIKSHFSI